MNSDPTYEAWKPCLFELLLELLNNSDPTYEAWKHIGGSMLIKNGDQIPILPTRHGNLSKDVGIKSTAKRIPILPTRHGNDDCPFHWEPIALIPILPTRHGNSAQETLYRA